MKALLAKLALVMAFVVPTSACYKATFYKDPSVAKGEQHEQWTDFFLFGLVGTQDFDVHQFCPTGEVALVQTGGNFGTGIVGVITIGIYTPRKVYVTCAQSGGSAVARSLELSIDSEGQPRDAHALIDAHAEALECLGLGPRDLAHLRKV